MSVVPAPRKAKLGVRCALVWDDRSSPLKRKIPTLLNENSNLCSVEKRCFKDLLAYVDPPL